MLKQTITRKGTPRHYVSQVGLQQLQDRLHSLEADYADLRSKLNELRQVRDVEDFDLVEDSVRLAFLEKEIAETRHTLAHCRVLPPTPGGQTVQIGSTVQLEHEGGILHCQLVSALEADPSQGRISDQSPLGRALVGKMLNAFVEVVAPRRRMSYRIVGIH
jgi:transcription elongation factor GreA